MPLKESANKIPNTWELSRPGLSRVKACILGTTVVASTRANSAKA